MLGFDCSVPNPIDMRVLTAALGFIKMPLYNVMPAKSTPCVIDPNAAQRIVCKLSTVIEENTYSVDSVIDVSITINGTARVFILLLATIFDMKYNTGTSTINSVRVYWFIRPKNSSIYLTNCYYIMGNIPTQHNMQPSVKQFGILYLFVRERAFQCGAQREQNHSTTCRKQYIFNIYHV